MSCSVTNYRQTRKQAQIQQELVLKELAIDTTLLPRSSEMPKVLESRADQHCLAKGLVPRRTSYSATNFRQTKKEAWVQMLVLKEPAIDQKLLRSSESRIWLKMLGAKVDWHCLVEGLEPHRRSCLVTSYRPMMMPPVWGQWNMLVSMREDSMMSVLVPLMNQV
tara:strand:- start:1350 stop:1841 length:492 start_codon:yes stop_codon:yes gene_type:complete